MNQLGLNIRPLLSYKAETFVQHSGVSHVHSQCKAILANNTFSLIYINGSARCGKTHLAVRLMEDISVLGKFANFIEGNKVDEWLSQERQFDESHVTIVDDADLYLASLEPGHSGPMVSVIERARHAGAKIILFSRVELGAFSFDEHVGSRLRAGHYFEIGAPAESEVEQILAVIARQRGLHLAGRKLTSPSKRIARDVGSIEDYVERVLHLSKVVGKKVDLGVLADAV